MAKKNKHERILEKAAKTLQVDLTTKKIDIWLKLIALLTLVGGLSILGNVISDTVSTRAITPGFYTLRIVIGIMAVSISYGIIERRSWAIWLYAVIVIIGFILNPWIAALPALILIYLYTQRKEFESFSIKKFISGVF